MADRRIFAVGNRARRFFSRIDVRHDHALRAVVEHARGMVMFLAWHTHDRRNAGRQCRSADLRCGVEIERAVLHVDEQPVEAGRLADGGDVSGARLAQPEAGRNFALFEALFGVVGIGLHVCSSV